MNGETVRPNAPAFYKCSGEGDAVASGWYLRFRLQIRPHSFEFTYRMLLLKKYIVQCDQVFTNSTIDCGFQTSSILLCFV